MLTWVASPCPLFGVKRTCRRDRGMSVNDPKRTSATQSSKKSPGRCRGFGFPYADHGPAPSTLLFLARIVSRNDVLDAYPRNKTAKAKMSDDVDQWNR